MIVFAVRLFLSRERKPRPKSLYRWRLNDVTQVVRSIVVVHTDRTLNAHSSFAHLSCLFSERRMNEWRWRHNASHPPVAKLADIFRSRPIYTHLHAPRYSVTRKAIPGGIAALFQACHTSTYDPHRFVLLCRVCPSHVVNREYGGTVRLSADKVGRTASAYPLFSVRLSAGSSQRPPSATCRN